MIYQSSCADLRQLIVTCAEGVEHCRAVELDALARGDYLAASVWAAGCQRWVDLAFLNAETLAFYRRRPALFQRRSSGVHRG